MIDLALNPIMPFTRRNSQMQTLEWMAGWPQESWDVGSMLRRSNISLLASGRDLSREGVAGPTAATGLGRRAPPIPSCPTPLHPNINKATNLSSLVCTIHVALLNLQSPINHPFIHATTRPRVLARISTTHLPSSTLTSFRHYVYGQDSRHRTGAVKQAYCQQLGMEGRQQRRRCPSFCWLLRHACRGLVAVRLSRSRAAASCQIGPIRLR
ncbi:hypothetical protein DAI22_05g275400 [Oryza sativa Japonica Group]|nr:hypothetical protein DAI22_05g275400 [Oryza sativa Japonica Group]KAF2932278.1 hypothetical protein DAI22_05g275400 [Oryza sativa Japonica Group]